MQLNDLNTLLDYHYWARDRALDAAARLSPEQFVQDIESSFRSVRDTLVHIYSAEWAWYARWQGDLPTVHLSPAAFPSVERLRDAWGRHEHELRRFINGLGDERLGEVCEYRTFNGQPGASPYWQMVVHLVNHASYHRGQVTTLLRQLGAEPAGSMDLIGFFRLPGRGSR